MPSFSPWRLSCALVLFCLFFFHCGYGVKHQLLSDFAGKRGLFVPVFQNDTDETGAERIFTDAIIHELASRHEVILSSRQQGGLELFGEITSIAYAPVQLTVPGYVGLQPYRRVPSQLGVQITLLLTLRDTDSGKVLWSRNFYDFRRVYSVTNRSFAYQGASAVGLIDQTLVESIWPAMAGDIVRDMYDQMLEVEPSPGKSAPTATSGSAVNSSGSSASKK